MKNKTYQNIFKTLTAFFSFSVFMTGITMLDLFITDIIFTLKSKTNPYYSLNATWRDKDPLNYLFDNYNSPLIFFGIMLAVALLIATVYGKRLNSRTETAIYIGPVAGLINLAMRFGGFFVQERYLLAATIFFIAYGIFSSIIMAKAAKKLNEAEIIEEEYKSPSDARRRNFYIMIAFYALASLYWVCFYGTVVYETVKSIKLGLKSVWMFGICEIWDFLFIDESIIGFVFLSFFIFALIASVTILFYRNILKTRTIVVLLIGCLLPIAFFLISMNFVRDSSYGVRVLTESVIKLLSVMATGVLGTVLMLKDLEEFD